METVLARPERFRGPGGGPGPGSRKSRGRTWPFCSTLCGTPSRRVLAGPSPTVGEPSEVKNPPFDGRLKPQSSSEGSSTSTLERCTSRPRWDFRCSGGPPKAEPWGCRCETNRGRHAIGRECDPKPRSEELRRVARRAKSHAPSVPDTPPSPVSSPTRVLRACHPCHPCHLYSKGGCVARQERSARALAWWLSRLVRLSWGRLSWIENSCSALNDSRPSPPPSITPRSSGRRAS